jgi:uncharacterized peroxidase-related enzyme
MNQAVEPRSSTDLIDELLGLSPANPVHALRHWREKVAQATQSSHQLLFDPALGGLSLRERLLVALYACRLTPAPQLTAYYRQQLLLLGSDDALVLGVVDQGDPSMLPDARLRAILQFAGTLIRRPVEGDKALLMRLPAAGLSTPAIITLAQLIAYLSYQTRVVAGLIALTQAQGAAVAAPAAATGGAGESLADHTVLRVRGFTNETLPWRAWLPTVAVDKATPEQIAVLEESHPKAKESDYYLTLIHQPAILRQRSAAFNAIMYAPGGMSRAERELGATVASRINRCVYCASVHAQRFEQLARRQDVIAQVFDYPYAAGTTPREREIVTFSIALTATPGELPGRAVERLREQGVSDREIFDLINSVAIFAWANRLMLNLGEPELPF